MVKVSVELTDDQAWAMAQFLKRIGWQEWRANAVDDSEADQMRAACEALRDALAETGNNPR